MPNILDILNDDKKMEEFVDGIRKEYIKKQAEKELFIKEKINIIMDKVYNHLLNNKSIIDEDISYFPERYDFSKSDFCLLLDILMNYSISINKCDLDKEMIFPNNIFYLKYKNKNMLISVLFGQGTTMIISKATKKNWKEDLSFSYEEYKKSLDNQE